MYVCPFEDQHVAHFLPLVHTRPVYGLRIGIRTNVETICESFTHCRLVLHCRKKLTAVTRQKFPSISVNDLPGDDGILFINGRYIPEPGLLLEHLTQRAQHGEPAMVFTQDDVVVAAWVPDPSDLPELPNVIRESYFESFRTEEVGGARLLYRMWHLVEEMPEAISRDYVARTMRKKPGEWPGAQIQEGVILVNPDQIYLAPGAVVRAGAILNAEDGPIFIDRNAIVMEAAIGRGPIYLGPNGEMKMGLRVDGAAVGEYGKIGGEVHQSIVHSFSNKAHDGYLGNSYIGKWCNIGADSNTSNLKNDYSNITLYNAALEDYEDTGHMFVGLYMGDHSKCGINTMFNTGTVVGVSCNIFNAGFPPRYIPSFSWGGRDGLSEFLLDKALKVAAAMMARRQVPFTQADRRLLIQLYDIFREKRESETATTNGQ